jgi:polyferredoxin
VFSTPVQTLRHTSQLAFFALFVLAPVFDWLRYDLTLGHAYVLGFEWHLGIDDYMAKRIGVREVGTNIFLRLFLPFFGASILLVTVSWHWGRLFCGWACPHFSVVEVLNTLLRRAIGKASLWDNKPLPAWHFGRHLSSPSSAYWWPTIVVAILVAFVWAVAILTYAVAPGEVYANLWRGSLPIRQSLFIAVVTLVLALEFIFARHLFCRYGCSVGLFQSLAWMMNRRALVVGFARERAAECTHCYGGEGPGDAACEIVCPMRLRPRTPKRSMFSCTQCGLCLDACTNVRDQPLLVWVKGEAACANEARMSLMGWEKL